MLKSHPFLKISSIFYFSYLDDSNKLAKGNEKFGRVFIFHKKKNCTGQDFTRSPQTFKTDFFPSPMIPHCFLPSFVLRNYEILCRFLTSFGLVQSVESTKLQRAFLGKPPQDTIRVHTFKYQELNNPCA